MKYNFRIMISIRGCGGYPPQWVFAKGVLMHNNNGFLIESKIKMFITYTDKYIISSIPKVHCYIRIHFEDECYNLVKHLYEAVWTKGNIRSKYITELLISISLLDFLIDQVRDLKCVNNKKIDNAISLLTDIKILVQGWKKTQENDK